MSRDPIEEQVVGKSTRSVVMEIDGLSWSLNLGLLTTENDRLYCVSFIRSLSSVITSVSSLLLQFPTSPSRESSRLMATAVLDAFEMPFSPLTVILGRARRVLLVSLPHVPNRGK